ncbi:MULTISPECIES: hypothetical protein [unclassified Streptomyces]|uniref:hypothetical protein n=1 Tax=unclassified Streptomyces TaxID=2593676 RepID=UPI002E11F452|nr:hypothetical protein OG452_17485 [Streptomyces sp. NBC_01197]WSS50362.1 hypothetical protein OG708_18040 [Streptomyces sp. NBC_01180]
MPPEIALLESRALRADHLGRVGVLDKVKALALLPDGIHLRTQDVARYFEVSTDVIKKLTQRHREELSSNGLRVLQGSDLEEFKGDNLSPFPSHGLSYPQPRSGLTVHTRRTVLNIAMVLRDSEVARRVRSYLLDTEEQHPAPVSDPGFDGLDRRVTQLESAMSEVGPALRELGPVLARMSDRLGALDQRLDATNRVVGAMSVRLSDVTEDMAEIKRRLRRRR